MEEAGVGEHPLKSLRGKREAEEILMPDLTAAERASHLTEVGGAVEPDRVVTRVGERLDVTTWATPKIEDSIGRGAFDRAQQRFDILGDVVVLRALPKGLRASVVVTHGAAGDLVEFVGAELTHFVPSLQEIRSERMG